MRLQERLKSPLGNRRLDLDVMRGTAILLAMGWHIGIGNTGSPVVDVLMWPARTFGWAGVDLFFVLSGFLMGGIIFREQQQTGRFDSKRFLIRRAFKLWPVFYVFLFAQLVLGDNPWETFFFQSFFHVQNYFTSSHAHLWSLAVEEHFYLALALAAPILFRRTTSPRTMLIGLASLLVLPLALRVIGFFAGATPVQLQTLTHFRLDGLAAGVLLALVSAKYPEVMDKLLRFRVVWLAITLAACAFVTVFPKQSGIGSTAGYTVTMIGAAGFMLLLYKAEWVPRFRFVLRPLGWLGIYSYALYLWHIAAARVSDLVVEKVAPGFHAPIVQTAMNYAFAIVVAVIMTKAIEWPALRLRNRIMPAESRQRQKHRAPARVMS